MLPYDGYSDGKSGQRRKYFNLAYRTLKGSDTKGPDQGYRLHLVYNCILEPTARDNLSNGGNDSAMMFSWQLSTTPMAMPYDRPSSHFIIDSELVPTIVLSTIEDILYGTPVTLPAFLTIDGLLAIFDANATFVVVDNGDGTCTITGPDTAVYVDGGDSTLWHIDSEGVSILDAFSFFAHSY
jgi:hypothetical protein